MADDVRARVRALILTGDNRVKQGGDRLAARARESFEQALALAEQGGIADDGLRAIIELRLQALDAATGRRPPP
jgi:hypothetical protein